MATKKALMFGAAALAAASFQANAQKLLAYVSSPLPSGTDTLVSVPVNNNVEVELETVSVAGSVITVDDSPEFAAGDYSAGSFARYYVRFIDGGAAGLWSNITVNSDTTLTIDNAEVAALANAAGGETIRVYKHHTVGSVFPDSFLDDADGGVLTTGGVADGLQLLFYSEAALQNKAPGSRASSGVINYTTFFNLGWGAGADAPLLPETAFVIRNQTGNDLQYVVSGAAPDHPVSYLFDASVNKDYLLGTGYPADVTVEETGIGVFDGRVIFTQGSGIDTGPGGDGGSQFSFTTFFNLGWGASAGVELKPNSAFVFRQSAADPGGKVTVEKPY